MKNPKFTAALTAVQREDRERVRLKEISLKWAKIAREKAKEDFFTRNGVGAMTHELDGIPPAHAITICLDIEPCDVELAFATNGTSLRRATLTALLAAMVVDEVAASDSSRPI